MDEHNQQHRLRLEQDALDGNKTAERLLLLTLIANADHFLVDDFLNKLQQQRGELERSFIEAELACFHAYPTANTWHQTLRDCSEAGHAEATFVANVYHDWAGKMGHSGELTWQEGWQHWALPVWKTVMNTKGVNIERSTGFTPLAFLSALRSMLAPGLRRSSVVDPKTGQAIEHPVRINQCVQWFPEQLGWLGKLFESRLATAGGYLVDRGEVCTLLSYQTGDRYRPHLDCISPQQARSPEGIAQGGQRMMTVLLAIGDDTFEGGETFFPDIDCTVRLNGGELLRFNNADIDGNPLRSSLHEGREVRSGEKLMVSKWVRAARTPYGKEVQLRSTR